jgi:hypothetical protein
MTEPRDLLGPRRPQARWTAAAQRRAEAKAKFEALPQAERDAIWARVYRILDEAVWYYAKSEQYRDNPHSYCRRRDFKDDSDFVFIIEFIRSGACDRERYPPTGKDGRYYDVLNLPDGRKVWPMGWPINYRNGAWCTTILNRKPVLPGDR